MAYTDEDMQRAAAMWSKGDSAELIARALKVSRNSVSGIMFRHRDMFPPRRRSGQPQVKLTMPKKIERKHEVIVRPVIKSPPMICEPTTFLEIEAFRCRWQVGGTVGPQMMCCNNPSSSLTNDLRGSYCVEHLARMYQRRVA